MNQYLHREMKVLRRSSFKRIGGKQLASNFNWNSWSCICFNKMVREKVNTCDSPPRSFWFNTMLVRNKAGSPHLLSSFMPTSILPLKRKTIRTVAPLWSIQIRCLFAFEQTRRWELLKWTWSTLHTVALGTEMQPGSNKKQHY